MNTLPLNTVFDTPSFAVNTQLESTGIRELTQDEIELVDGALCLCKEHIMNSVKAGNKQIVPGMVAGLVTGVLVGQPVQGALIGGIGFWAAGFTSHLLDDCSCGV